MDRLETASKIPLPKERMVAMIRAYQRIKPEEWKKHIRHLFERLDQAEDPYCDLEWNGTEMLGRGSRRNGCPDYDSMDPESDPDRF